MTSAAYSTGPASRALFNAAVLIFCCCFLHQALAIDKSIDDLDEEYDCILQMDLNEDVFPAKVQDGIVTFMPTNRNNNLKFTALSTSRAEQHFSIFVKDYDPEIVPTLGEEQTATLDDDKQTKVWSCRPVIEKAVQTKCHFEQEKIKCRKDDSGMRCNTTFDITCATKQSSPVTGIERDVFFFTSDISTSVYYENFPCKFEVKAIEEEFHLLTKKGDPISKNAEVGLVTQCLKIPVYKSTTYMVSTASSTGPASSTLSSNSATPSPPFNFMVCVKQWNYLLLILLVTILLLLLLFVVLLIVCCCKDEGKQSKTSTDEKNVTAIRQPKKEPLRMDDIDEMPDFQTEGPVEQDCDGVEVPDTVDIDIGEHDCIVMPTDAITDTQPAAYDEPKEVLPESDDKPEKEEDGDVYQRL